MNDRATLKNYFLIIFIYIILWLLVNIWPKYLDSSLGLIIAFPLLSIYLFNAIGIPGLLQNDGACGWGWCSPTIFGWIFLVTFWLVVVWFIAKGITSLTNRSSGDAKKRRAP